MKMVHIRQYSKFIVHLVIGLLILFKLDINLASSAGNLGFWASFVMILRVSTGIPKRVGLPVEEASVNYNLYLFPCRSDVDKVIPRFIRDKLRAQQWLILVQDHFRSSSFTPAQSRKRFLGNRLRHSHVICTSSILS